MDAREREPKDEIRLRTLQVVKGRCFRLRICGQPPPIPRPLSIHVVVPAARAPIGVAMRWRRRRHPCPRHHDEHCGQDKGTVQEQGRAGKVVRALCVPSMAATQGLSRLITVNRNCCSMALSWPCHVVPKLDARAFERTQCRALLIPTEIITGESTVPLEQVKGLWARRIH